MDFSEDLGGGITLHMVAIPGDKFMMGLPEVEGENSVKLQHEMIVQLFFTGKYPVGLSIFLSFALLFFFYCFIKYLFYNFYFTFYNVCFNF